MSPCSGRHPRRQVIAKIPKVDAEKFAALFHEKEDRARGDHAAREFRDLIFSGIDGNFAARDLPELVIKEALDYLLCKDSDLQGDNSSGYSPELELHFGSQGEHSLQFFPAKREPRAVAFAVTSPRQQRP